MSTIYEIDAREILDSRGNPTVEVDVILSDGSLGRAAVPSGANAGENEALELRDGRAKRYLGKGVTKAVNNIIKKIGPALQGVDATDQLEVDRIMLDMDGRNQIEVGCQCHPGGFHGHRQGGFRGSCVAFVQVSGWTQCQGFTCSHGQCDQRWGPFGCPH